jgi:hypothetical protein
MGPLTQKQQARCVRNVADHLTEDGVFVTEMYVPDPLGSTAANGSR